MMDSRQISSTSGDVGKGDNVIQVNQGTFVLKNRWTGPEDKQTVHPNNSGGHGDAVKYRNKEEYLDTKKEVDCELLAAPRENIDSRLRKLMSGDPGSIPVFMLEYRAAWVDAERKKRLQSKINLKMSSTGTTEKSSDPNVKVERYGDHKLRMERSGQKSSDQKIKLERSGDRSTDQKIKLEGFGGRSTDQKINMERSGDKITDIKKERLGDKITDQKIKMKGSCDQKIEKESIDSSVSGVEQLFKNVKMSPEVPIKQNETGNGTETKNMLLEEKLRCDFGLFPKVTDLNNSFTDQIDDNPKRDDCDEEKEQRITIDDDDVDYIVRHLPLGKLAGSSIKPSGMGIKPSGISTKTSGLGTKTIKPSGSSIKPGGSSIKPNGLGTNFSKMEIKDNKLATVDTKYPPKEIFLSEKVEKNFDEIKKTELLTANVKKNSDKIKETELSTANGNKNFDQLEESELSTANVEKNLDQIKETELITAKVEIISDQLEETELSTANIDKISDQIKEPKLSTANIYKNSDENKETESVFKRGLANSYSEDIDDHYSSTNTKNATKENATPNNLLKLGPKHHIERVPSKKRKFTEVLGSIEDRLKKVARTELEQPIMDAAMEAFDKWWEQQELEYQKKLKGSKLNPENDPK